MTESATHAADTNRRWTLLMAAAQAGDRTSYETLLHECIPFIKAVARRQGVPQETLDDVVQETLLTIHRARQTYDPNRSFAAWLRVIAQRRALDCLRSLGRKLRVEQHAPLAAELYADPAPGPHENLGRADDAAGLGQAISLLPEGQRQAVDHLAMREQTLAQASAETGRSTGALKVNLHRALKTLRTRLRTAE